MHVPKTESSQIRISGFEESLGNQTFESGKWLCVPSSYEEYRYILGKMEGRTLITIGMNPSTAMPGQLDRTLKSVMKISGKNGFNSFVMFNVYAQRATLPKDMDHTLNKILHAENMKALDWLLNQACRNPTIWAAWGTLVERRKYFKDCLREIVDVASKYNAEWLQSECRTKKKHPHHPLYIGKAQQSLEKFDMKGYLDHL